MGIPERVHARESCPTLHGTVLFPGLSFFSTFHDRFKNSVEEYIAVACGGDAKAPLFNVVLSLGTLKQQQRRFGDRRAIGVYQQLGT